MQTPKPSRNWGAGVLIALGLFVIYFAGIGSYPLVDPDEPVYAQIAREMTVSGHWGTPHYWGSVWFDKPPMYYWLAASCMRVLGVSELSARLPSAIAALAVVALTYLLGLRAFGRPAGIAAGLVVATSLQQIVLARSSVTDMTLTAFLVGSLYCFIRWMHDERPVWLWSASCGACMGAAALTKGPVAFVLLPVTFLVYAIWTKSLRVLFSRWLAVCVIGALAVAVPWYANMLSMHREEFTKQFVLANNLERFLKPEHKSSTGAWYSYSMNFPVLLGFFFPWSCLLPQAIVVVGRKNNCARLCVAWAAVVFVFFSLSKTQLPTYIFPMYAACAVLVGAYLSEWTNNKALNKGLRGGLIAALAMSVGIAYFLLRAAQGKYPDAAVIALVLGAVLVLTMALALFACGSAKWRYRTPWLIAGGMVVFAVLIVYGVAPVASVQFSG